MILETKGPQCTLYAAIPIKGEETVFKNILKALDGRKTAIGLFLYVVGGIISNLGYPETGGMIIEIGLSMTGIGALHKLWKGQ